MNQIVTTTTDDVASTQAPDEVHGNLTGRYVGRSVKRSEDRDLLMGRATFVGDVKLPGLLHAVIYRSPHAHARLLKLDLTRVQALPGVVMVLAGSDLPQYVRRMEPFPFQSRDPFLGGNPRIKFFDRHGLAIDRVRYVGEPVAVIVAESRYIGEDALDLVDAEYEVLPPVLDAEAGAGPDAPKLYDSWEDNVSINFHVSGGDVERAFADADVVVSEVLQHHRFSGTPIEPRGIVGSYDRNANFLTVWDSTQISHVVAALLEDSILVPESIKVRVIAPKVGGGFGQKWGFYPEELVVPLASVLCGRPVKWIETRREHMVATNHAREQKHHIEMALKSDGTILGVRDKIYADMGDAYPVGGFASVITTTMFVPGAYRIQNYDCHLFGVVTNKTPYGAHRGFGKSEAAYVIERMVDIAATAVGMDPAELRQKNFIQPDEFPYRCVTGSRYDSGDYPRALDMALSAADYLGARAMQEAARTEGRLVGIGMALAIEPSSSTRMGSYNSGYYTVRIKMDPNGRVFVATGGNDEGQGHATTISQLVAEELGVTPAAVSVLEGDTMGTPYGSGSYSSRFSIVGTSSVTMAARELSAKLRRIAANLLEVDPDDLELEGGEVRVRGDVSATVSLQRVARIAYHRIHDLVEDEEPGLELSYHYRDPNVDFSADERGRVAMFSSFPYAADVAVVEVDPETGKVVILKYVSVHDCGNMLNPRIVEGQHVGALAHGIGGVMLEEFAFDAQGQPLNGNFRDYLIPTALDMPELTLDHLISPNPFTPGGYKGAGETGTVSPVPCLANAVRDALMPIGVELTRLPLSPARIWHQIHSDGAGP